MVNVSGPSPKRRRTDNGPVSAESIAQANSTLSVFTGQRQNRWMQGYVPNESGGGSGNVTQHQTPSLSRAAVNNGRVQTANALTNTHDGAAAGQHARGTQVRQSPNGAGAMSPNSAPLFNASVDPRATNRNVVEYEAPGISTAQYATFPSINHSRKSLERMARTAAQPGLPSPAPSDGNENTHSPTTGIAPNPPQARPATGFTDPPQRTSPGRPPTYPANAIRNGSVGTGTASSNPSIHQRVPSNMQMQQPVAASPLATTANSPWNLQTHAFTVNGSTNAPHRAPPLVPSHPHAHPPQQTNQIPPQSYDSNVMLQALDKLQNSMLPREHYREKAVDSGRITLLRDAIKKGDNFYLILSQLHTVTLTPSDLPRAVREVKPRAWRYLESLICANSQVSEMLRDFLKDFPAAIKSMYSYPQTATAYQHQVQEIVNFLHRLPTNWDTIVLESKKRKAPPLAQDLFESIGLSSPVLQTTAFRAIARMIWGSTDRTNIGLEKLEYLHELDQKFFFSGQRRSSAQKTQAYRAYRRTLEAWQAHEPMIVQFEMMMQQQQQSLLPQQARQPPPPPEFWLPQQELQFFQKGLQPAGQQMVPPNQPIRMTPAQQQQTIMSNNQTIMRVQQRIPPGGRLSPMQQQQPVLPQIRNPVVPIPPQMKPPGPHLVFPHESEQPRAQPTQPDTNRSALHQAHLRSPIPGPTNLAPGALRLYRRIGGYALSPRKINKDLPLETINFELPQLSFDAIPKTLPPQNPGEPPIRTLDESSQIFRLRCAAIPAEGFPNESAWVESDNYWPDNLFLELNGVMLETRRKLHHGRYLPIDLTPYMKAGKNELKAMVNRMSTDTRPFEYALAVEIVGIVTHESIVRTLPTTSAVKSLDTIKKSLSGSNDEDDIAITSSNMIIKLFDPYSSSRIFDTPVRGSNCKHRDCFDLETFLSICKREKPGWPTVVDCWRCPLCRGDVRPQTLVIDGFLVEVRKELVKKHLLNTRAIVVEADGSWKPKEEERTGVRSPSLEREERGLSIAKNTPRSKKMPEVIELD